MAIVTLDSLTKTYEHTGRPAVEDVSLEIGDGELMVLLGPSGCGKTTTLRMIAGLESISSGTLSIDGRVVNRVPAKDRDIAMVFQSYALYPHMSVKENLAFGLRRRSIAKAEIERRVANVADVLGLKDLLHRRPHALSGGQRQRVALGRAIVRDPKVFLFDEPLSNLDAALRVSTRGEIASLHRRLGATMIYVTHDQVEAMTLGTRICIMSSGRVEQVGSPIDVYRYPANTFVAGFLGNPPMNLLETRVVEGGDARSIQLGGETVRLGVDRVPESRAGTPVTFGIRPEHVAVAPAGAASVAVTTEIQQIERLGAETVVIAHLAASGHRLVIRHTGDLEKRPGDDLVVWLDLAQAHVFDAEGDSLTARIDRRT
ncbi:MAG: sn-glycerol-3-phosphate ABC transporter ATP-binding protein UgpC [Hyphomicrobiaceae bacterium]